MIVVQKVLRIIKRELIEVLPPTLFFFVAFNVVIITNKLMLEQYGITFYGFANATVGAFIVAKAALVTDQTKFINKYPHKPLIYNVLWKTIIYALAALAVQAIEEIFPLWWKYRSVRITIERTWDAIIWPHFWAVHIWLVFLLFLYVSFRELARAIGEKKFFQIFLGITISENNAQRRKIANSG
jgi:hypothetical protein